MIVATCPNCQKTVRLRDDYSGRRVKCPGCGQAYTVSARKPAYRGNRENEQSPIIGVLSHPTTVFHQNNQGENDEQSEVESASRPEHVTKSRFAISTALVIANIVTWGIVLLAVILGGLLFFASLRAAGSAVQEAAAGALFSTVFIALYVVARCIEKLTAASQRLRFELSEPNPNSLPQPSSSVIVPFQ